MTLTIPSKFLCGDRFYYHRIRKDEELERAEKRAERLKDLSEALESNYEDLLSRTDEENRLHIANTRYNQPPRYFSDPVYAKLWNVHNHISGNEIEKTREESSIRYILQLTNYLLLCCLSEKIKQRRMRESDYNFLLGLSEHEIKDRCVHEAEEVFDSERKKQGWFSIFKKYHNHSAAQAAYKRIEERYNLKGDRKEV